MRGGAIIGVPLTLLQLAIHQHTPATIDGWAIANNFALCNAIYDADRIEGGFFAAGRGPTRLAALASSAYYLSSPDTAPLSLGVAALHLGYTKAKPLLAPAKPLVVGSFWSLGIYYAPLLRATGGLGDDLLLPASLCLSVAALSHAADVVDAAEDEAAGVVTPAVALGEGEARAYALALALAAAYLHALSPQPSLPYDATVLATAGGVAFATAPPPLAARGAALAGLLLLGAAYGRTHDYELLSLLLQSSEGSHGLAIRLSTTLIERAYSLDEPYRSLVVEGTLRAVEGGDEVGRALLDAFEDACLRRL